MKDGIREVLGKTISGIVVGENSTQPKVQLFITFTDGTYFEIYGESFSCASGVNRGGVAEATKYATESLGTSINRTYVSS
jgi:hypothetical protein